MANFSFSALERDAVQSRLSLGRPVLVAPALGAAYGFFMGWYAVALHWGSGRPDGYVQLLAGIVKLPALFLCTLAVTFPSLFVFSALAGVDLGLTATLRVLVSAIVLNLAVAASLGTILAFFTLSTTSYPFMVVLNVTLLASPEAPGSVFCAGRSRSSRHPPQRRCPGRQTQARLAAPSVHRSPRCRVLTVAPAHGELFCRRGREPRPYVRHVMSRTVRDILLPTHTPPGSTLSDNASAGWLIAKVIVMAGVAFGACMGSFSADSWERLLCIPYVAIKLPLLIFASSMVCLPGFIVLNTVLGLQADFAVALRAIAGAQAALALVLLSLGPFTCLFCLSGISHDGALRLMRCFSSSRLWPGRG